MIGAVDTEALVELMWAAPLAVLTVTVSWGLVVNGATRSAEARRDGRAGAAGAYAVVALFGAALFAVAIVLGLIIMLSKG
ncbi:MAG TPA: hypothetical protein VMY78_06455 [Solirubrobacteraceae bacterium]|nr:hypothetical protein [Solirubrobacteraceae bacterium]